MLQFISRSGIHDFDIMRENELVASVKKKGWFQGPAEAVINGERIKFTSESILSTRYTIHKNGRPCGQIAIDWLGNIKISLMRVLDAGHDVFKLKSKTWIAKRYVLFSTKTKTILTFQGTFNWAKLSYNYTIVEGEHDYPDEAINELLVYCVFALKLASFQRY